MYRQRGKRNGILPFDQSIGEADRRSLSGACSRQIHTTRLRPQRVGVGETRSREGEHHCKLKFHFTIHCYEIDVLPRTKPARWTSCPYLISRPQVEMTWFTTQEPFSPTRSKTGNRPSTHSPKRTVWRPTLCTRKRPKTRILRKWPRSTFSR